jgi:hypothetical protein
VCSAPARDGVDLRGRALGADAGERQRGQHVDVGGERTTGLGGRALEDQRLLADRVEVDLLLDDPRRSGPAGRRLAALHRDGRDRPDGAALDAVEPGDGARRHMDAAAVGVGERHPVGATEQGAAREHDEVTPGAERPGAIS